MANNFLDTVKNYFSGDFANQAANSLDESGSGVSRALSALIPASLVGILAKATTGTEGANSIFEMAKSAIGFSPTMPNLSNLHNDERGSDMPSRIFGGSESQIANSVAGFAGIKNASASSLMLLAVPSIFGILGRHAEQNNLSASGLAGFLSSQKDNILNAIPAGFSLASLPGLGSFGSSISSGATNVRSHMANMASDVTDSTRTAVARPGGAKWLLPLIIIIAAIALLWYFSRSCNSTRENNTVTTDTSTVSKTDTAVTAPTPVATTKESIKVKLPNGKELDANKGGIEDQLVAFLSSDWKSLSDDSLKNKWFDFDNLNFNTGKATLLPESEKQLDNIAEILKAFPDAKIKIGGYTDATGNAAANKRLSQDRANAAKTGLEKRGTGKQVISAEGYGSQYAKYPATATEEEKALDRHVSVSVRK